MLEIPYLQNSSCSNVISMHIYILQNHIVQKKKLSNDGIAYTVRVPQRVKLSRPFYPPKKKVCSGRSINFNPNTFFQVFSFMCHTQSSDDDHFYYGVAHSLH